MSVCGSRVCWPAVIVNTITKRGRHISHHTACRGQGYRAGKGSSSCTRLQITVQLSPLRNLLYPALLSYWWAGAGQCQGGRAPARVMVSLGRCDYDGPSSALWELWHCPRARIKNISLLKGHRVSLLAPVMRVIIPQILRHLRCNGQDWSLASCVGADTSSFICFLASL